MGAEQKRALLALARRSVAEAAERQAPQDGPPDEMDRLPEALHARCGAFVTLKRDGRLRGCIGRIMPEQPLCRCVWDVAALAAVRDRRFAPVSTSEVDALSIEISVLEPPLKVGDTEEIEVGRDGLIVSKGRHSGILLPQVATANGWNRAQFLDNTCLKAGLPRDAWRSGDVTILRFTAQVFGEQESGLH
ncbi:MAG: hypothetical protein AMK73_04245 [Planctomycetes bacterium SM23_32]|nr:MAG: hypothetical protein AMK73_04245 [Planctomycetes bacterium SM23_32]